MHAPLSSAFRAEWCSLEQLKPIADEWRALAVRAIEPNVFYEPEFMLPAAAVFGANAGAILVRSATGRLAGLFPMRIERLPGGLSAKLVGWTHPFGPLGTPLVDCDEPEAVVTAWLGRLSRAPTLPKLLLMPLLPRHGAFSAVLDSVLKRSNRPSAVFGEHRRALLEPEKRRDGYIERAVSALQRKKLRRLRRRLEEIAPVTFATVTSMHEIRDALKDFLVLEASGWKGVAGTAIVQDPALRTFVETAVTALAADRRARVDRLLLNGRAIAAAVTLMSGDTAWCWKISYNEGVGRFSPGVQLVHELTSDLLAAPMPARVDSCATAEHPMIDHIWRERLFLNDRLIALHPSGIPFALTTGIETARRSAIAAAKAVRDSIRGR